MQSKAGHESYLFSLISQQQGRMDAWTLARFTTSQSRGGRFVFIMSLRVPGRPTGSSVRFWGMITRLRTRGVKGVRTLVVKRRRINRLLLASGKFGATHPHSQTQTHTQPSGNDSTPCCVLPTNYLLSNVHSVVVWKGRWWRRTYNKWTNKQTNKILVPNKRAVLA